MNPIEDTRLVVDWQPRETKRGSRCASPGRQQSGCLPRRTLDDALVAYARAAGARFVQGTVTEPILSEGNVVGVELRHHGTRTSVLAHHLIAADGATSRLRRQMSLPPDPHAASSYAVRRYVRTQEPLERLFEVYVPIPDSLVGYGWVFPISEHVANVGIGYVTARGLARPRPITDLLDSFLALLQQHRGSELGSLEPLGPAHGAPLGIGFSTNRCAAGGIVFVGDAARTCDPITGEGIDQAMRSAHASALTLHHAVRGGGRPAGAGLSIARSNPRLGQDSAMIARLGHQLLKRRHSEQSLSSEVFSEPTPFFSAARSMIAAEVDYPTMSATPAGELASRLGFAEALHALDDRLRDEVRSEFILCSELSHREVCSGIGPLGALMLFASQAVCGSRTSARSLDAALAVELLQVFATMLGRVTAANGDQAKANNALTVTIADYVLSRAVSALAGQGAVFSEMLADAIEASGEAIALLPDDWFQIEHPVQRYMEWARFTAGASFSLAARIGARLAGSSKAVEETLCAAGESLGIAVQICEDVLSLRREDPVMGAAPWRILKERRLGLPVLLAVEEDQRTASLIASATTRAEWQRITDIIMDGDGLARAREMCREYIDHTKKIAVEIAGHGTPLEALSDLPSRCLAPRATSAQDESKMRVSPTATPVTGRAAARSCDYHNR
jgi:flavin-dependent dehydrogenase